MRAGALAPYEHSLRTGAALQLWRDTEPAITLDVARWLAAADETDLDLVGRSAGPVLDVGCGPGRLVAALTTHGRLALGIDIAGRAVALTRARGLNVLQLDVFAPLPGEGRWRTVLLIDGNVGIGGDVDALLARCCDLLSPDGQVLVEVDPRDDVDECGAVRFAIDGVPLGPSFPWCTVGIDAVRHAAERVGLCVHTSWRLRDRQFARLVRR